MGCLQGTWSTWNDVPGSKAASIPARTAADESTQITDWPWLARVRYTLHRKSVSPVEMFFSCYFRGITHTSNDALASRASMPRSQYQSMAPKPEPTGHGAQYATLVADL